MAINRDGSSRVITMTLPTDEITGEVFEIMGFTGHTDATLADVTTDITISDSADNIIARFRMPAYTTKSMRLNRPIISTGLKFLSGPANAHIGVYLR